TVAGLAERIAAARQGEQAAPLPPLRPAPREPEPEPSLAQEPLWFFEQLAPGTAAYNVSVPVRLQGGIEIAALDASMKEVMRRHQTLRSRFEPRQGRPVVVLTPADRFHLPLVELRALAPAERKAEAQRWLTRESRRPFDLARGPLLRALLLRLREDEHACLVTFHHIIIDGWSVGVLIHELTVLYHAFSQGLPSPLTEPPVQYADYAHWQRRWLKGEALERQLGYWKRQLAGAPPLLELPTDRPRGVARSFRGKLLPVTLGEELAGGLAALSRHRQATLYMTLLAAFATLLGRICGQRDVVVGSPIAGRNRKEIEDLIGFFVNTLLMRTDLSADSSGDGPTFRRLLSAVRRTALDAYAHQDLPFDRLVEELQPQRDAGSNPLFQVMFVFQNLTWRRRELPEVTFSPLPPDG
ncbi:MAG: non-ribosomal peptide synthetase, partial [bacterium]|nr:non-ribosomal peptide synthetase [bacterium]